MKKHVYLISTAVAALLVGTVFAAAQNTQKQAPSAGAEQSPPSQAPIPGKQPKKEQPQAQVFFLGQGQQEQPGKQPKKEQPQTQGQGQQQQPAQAPAQPPQRSKLKRVRISRVPSRNPVAQEARSRSRPSNAPTSVQRYFRAATPRAQPTSISRSTSARPFRRACESSPFRK